MNVSTSTFLRHHGYRNISFPKQWRLETKSWTNPKGKLNVFFIESEHPIHLGAERESLPGFGDGGLGLFLLRIMNCNKLRGDGAKWWVVTVIREVKCCLSEKTR